MASPHGSVIVDSAVNQGSRSRRTATSGSGEGGNHSYQPYHCLICQSRFTRHENLKRHAAMHSRSQNDTSLPCDHCQATFSRSDLRHRHMKRKHPQLSEKRPKPRTWSRSSVTSTSSRREADIVTATQASLVDKTAESPTPSPDSSHGILQRIDTPGEIGAADGGMWPSPSRQMQPEQDPETTDEIMSTIQESQHATTMAFDTSTQQTSVNCHHIHDQPQIGFDQSLLLEPTSFLKPALSFDAQIQAMAMPSSITLDPHLAMFDFNQDISGSLLSPDNVAQFQDEWLPTATQTAEGCKLFFSYVSHFVPFLHEPTFDPNLAAPHLVLSMLCLAYQYGEDPDTGSLVGSGVPLANHCFHRAQALIASEEILCESGDDDLLHYSTKVQSYLLLQLCAMMYLCGRDSASGLKMHSKMIALARAGGLMQPITDSTPASSTTDLESLWRHFVRAESHKRTLFAVHQIDALWYQFLSIPRSISHLEIKHDLPCVETFWTASDPAEWAHRQLVARNGGSSMQYADAVRRLLRNDLDVDSIPAFDPYGAINIAQFLISSAREISGWSTMTGMVSLERVEPLKRSLVALRPFIQAGDLGQSDKAPASMLCEATWRAAIIELQMWSPYHTGGIIECSMDAVLNQSDLFGPSCKSTYETDVKAIQPHLDWFLRYLDATIMPYQEAPWLTLYAFKAFSIAWKLVRGGAHGGGMAVVGVEDAQAGLDWAKMVFERRRRWQIGKLILTSLDALTR